MSLTPLESRVLAACQSLQAAGIYPTPTAIRAELNEHRAFGTIRDMLVRCGLLVITTEKPMAFQRPRGGVRTPSAMPKRAKVMVAAGPYVNSAEWRHDRRTIRRMGRWARVVAERRALRSAAHHPAPAVPSDPDERS